MASKSNPHEVAHGKFKNLKELPPPKNVAAGIITNRFPVTVPFKDNQGTYRFPFSGENSPFTTDDAGSPIFNKVMEQKCIVKCDEGCVVSGIKLGGIPVNDLRDENGSKIDNTVNIAHENDVKKSAYGKNVTFDINVPSEIISSSGNASAKEIAACTTVQPKDKIAAVFARQINSNESVFVIMPTVMQNPKASIATVQEGKEKHPGVMMTLETYKEMLHQRVYNDAYLAHGLEIFFVKDTANNENNSYHVNIEFIQTVKRPFTPQSEKFPLSQNDKDEAIIENDSDMLVEKILSSLRVATAADSETGDVKMKPSKNLFKTYFAKISNYQGLGLFEHCAAQNATPDKFCNYLQEKTHVESDNSDLYNAMIQYFATIIDFLSKHQPSYNINKKETVQDINQLAKFCDIIFHIIDVMANGPESNQEHLSKTEIDAIIHGLNQHHVANDDPILHLADQMNTLAFQKVRKVIRNQLFHILPDTPADTKGGKINAVSPSFAGLSQFNGSERDLYSAAAGTGMFD
jgi:hypothetical protein